jgi:tetratricopeptide (TPR) repeat protein
MRLNSSTISWSFGLSVILLGLSVPAGSCNADPAEHDHPIPEKLGTVSFPISCGAATEKDFEHAVALLHSFAYSAAEKAFHAVAAKNPNCAMARWGVAMSYYHPLWEPHFTPQGAEQGRRELDEAKRLGGSERERGFIDALDQLYGATNTEAPAPYKQRAEAYQTSMAALAEHNPNDVECHVFYALALLGTAAPTDRTHANEKKAVRVLEPLFQKYPEHPGIAHYLIHACDNSEMATRGLPAAKLYSQIAPSAPHALHMPSHIHTRLGRWEDSIASNRAARKAAHLQGDIGEELHAMDYLTYAYLQLGRDADAENVLEDLSKLSDLQAGEFKIGYAASAMPVRYAIERRQWNDAARLPSIPGAQPQVAAITSWARAVGLARGGDSAAAGQEIEKLKTARDQLQSAHEEYWANQVGVEVDEALGWVAFSEKKNDEAIQLMRKAADEEDAVEKRPVTPGAIVPAREQLGDLLLQLGRPQEAVAEFETALRLTPNRRGSMQGKKQALELVAAKK